MIASDVFGNLPPVQGRALGTAKVIASGTAKVIASGTAKLIRWTNVQSRRRGSVARGGVGLHPRAPIPGLEEKLMCMRRLPMDRLQELVRLHRLGKSGRQVARLLVMSPNTERDYRTALIKAALLAGAADALPELEALKEAVLTFSPPKVAPQQVSSVDRWADAISALEIARLQLAA